MNRRTSVLLPGNMCDARVWPAVVRAKFGRMAMVDADPTAGTRIAAMAARVLADVLGSLLPVGFSMGGIVTLEMARQASKRMAGLVLACG